MDPANNNGPVDDSAPPFFPNGGAQETTTTTTAEPPTAAVTDAAASLDALKQQQQQQSVESLKEESATPAAAPAPNADAAPAPAAAEPTPAKTEESSAAPTTAAVTDTAPTVNGTEANSSAAPAASAETAAAQPAAAAPAAAGDASQIAPPSASAAAPLTNGLADTASASASAPAATSEAQAPASEAVKTEPAAQPTSGDVVMGDATAPAAATPAAPATTAIAPTAAPAAGIPPSSASATSIAGVPPSSGGTSSAEPPAKRQRKESDGNNAPALDPNVIIGSAAEGEIKFTIAQIKYAQNAVKALKARNEARAFLAPVDPVALNIPNYRSVVKEPMDLGTVDIKLALTAAAAKGGNKPTEKCKLAPQWGLDVTRDVYLTPEAFERDVRLVFSNCRTFNGPAHLISQSADVLEAAFDKQMKSLPSPDAPPPVPASVAAAQQNAPLVIGPDGQLVPATGTVALADSLIASRPKREIHPPPPRDISYDEPQALKSKKLKKKSRASMTPAEAAHWDKQNKEEVKFCAKVIDELLKPSHSEIAWVFYEIPDKSYDFAPAYYAMIKKPISLTMIQKRMRSNGYVDGDDFDADVQLLFKNCFTFNQPGSDVAIMGEKLKELYEKQMEKRPVPKPWLGELGGSSHGGVNGFYEEEQVDEATLLAKALREQIDILSSQALELEQTRAKATGKALALAKNSLSALGALPDLTSLTKGSSAKRRKSITNGGADTSAKKPKKKKPSSAADDAPRKPKKPKKPSSSGGGASASAAAASYADDDEDDIRVVTYDQKEELAAKITELPEDRLEGALKIIAEDKPHNSANDDEEIELDIDDLSPRTLYKLYRYVVRPKDKKTTNSNVSKSASDGRKRGTGGKKRKNLDEDEESERIRKLQAQLQQFEGGQAAAGGSAAGATGVAGHDDLVASESSGDEDDSDESGSDY